MASYTTLPIPLGCYGPQADNATCPTLAINFTGNVPVLGPNFNSSLSRINLVRLRPSIGIGTEQNGRGTVNINDFFTRNMNEDKRRIEQSFNEQVTAIEQIQLALQLAAAADARAQEAKNENEALKAEQSLKESHTEPLSVLSAANDGTVTIIAHQRVYGDGSTVEVDAGALTGQFGTVYVHYSDSDKTGGAVNYETSSSNPTQSNGVHVVGAVTVPDATQPPVSGEGPKFPGYIDIGNVFL